MVQQKSLEPYQVKTYIDYVKFFQESLGIKEPLRKEIPQDEIITELENAKEIGFKEVGKGIIAKYALLTFFPSQMRQNKLIILYIFKKLLKGKTPLSNRSKSALFKYYSRMEDELKRLVNSVSDLSKAMLDAMDKLLPTQNVDFYFDNYLKRLIYWEESLLVDDYPMLNAIVDNFWLSQNWDYPIESINMIFTISHLFDAQKKPFSLEFFHKYVEDNSEGLVEKFGKSQWILDKIHREFLWSKISNQGVNFVYKINSKVLGLFSVQFILQLHPDTNYDLLKFAFEFLQNTYYIFEHRSQRSLVITGSMYVPRIDINFLHNFFGRLKDMGVIIEYMVNSGDIYSVDSRDPFINTDIQLARNLENQTKNKKNPDENIDALDNIFLKSLRRIGFTGFPLNDIKSFIPKIRSLIVDSIFRLEQQVKNLNSLDEIKKKSLKSLNIIHPRYFHLPHVTTIGTFLEKTHINNIENLYFFGKWLDLFKLLNKYKNKRKYKKLSSLRRINPTLYINLTNEIRKLEKFIGEIIKKNIPRNQEPTYSPKSIINSLIQSDSSEEIITQLVGDLESVIFILRYKEQMMEVNPESLKRVIILLKKSLFRNVPDMEIHLKSDIETNYERELQLNSYSDSELAISFESRLNSYVNRKIISPNLLYSLVTESMKFYECWHFPSQTSIQTKKMLFNHINNKKFSIQKNPLGEWDIVFGSIESDEIEKNWRFIQKSKIPFVSYIPTAYDSLFHFDRLFNFNSNGFPSIKPKLKSILNFCVSHLNHSETKKETQFSEYVNKNQIIEEMGAVEKNKSWKSILRNNLDKCGTNFSKNLENIFRTFVSARDISTSEFLSVENISLKDIQVEVNWPKLGLEEYIISFKIKKEEFTHKALPNEVNTKEFLCVPGIKEIYISPNSGYFQKNLIHFVFPFNSPPYNLFHSLERWNYIEDLSIIRIKSKKIWFNKQILLENAKEFHPWISIAHRIATSKGEMPGEEPITYEYSPGQNLLGADSIQFSSIESIYGKNIRRLKNIPVFGQIDKLFKSELIWYKPRLDNIYPLPLRVILQLYPLTPSQFKIFYALFSAVPMSIQYTVEFEEEQHIYEGLHVELRFHECNLSKILVEIGNIVEFLDIEHYHVIPSVMSISKEQFVGYKLKNYPNLFNSFIWKDNRFNNIKLLDRSGPLDYRERYKQLK